MAARIEVPASYLAAVNGRYQTGFNPGANPLFVYLAAGYGYVIEGPSEFVLAACLPAWLGPRPIALPFTLRIPQGG